MQLTFSAANPAVCNDASLNCGQSPARGGGRGKGDTESERKVKLCAFWHLRYPKVVPLAVTWRSVRALCIYPGRFSLSRSSPGRLIVMRIATIQRARTRVPNRLGGLKPVCVGDGPPTLR